MNDARLDRAGRLWVASSLGLARLDRERGELVLLDSVETPGLQLGGGVLDIGAGVDGRLWLGTPQGLVRFDPDGGRSERFAHDPQQHQSLSDDFVLAIHTDPAGRVWIGTEAGLNRVDVDADDRVSFQRFGVQHGLPDQTVSAIASDTTGTLWVGTNRGIASFDAGEQRFHAFSAGDGIPDSSVNRRAVLAASDGSVYFGTFSGLLRVFPERLASTGPKALMLSAYELGGRPHINLAGPAPLILETGYTEARVRFQVAAFGDHRRLSYRMTGLESDWTDMNAGLVVGYDPLPSGHYRFEVRQLENDGHWLPPSLSVALTVRPPPWRSQVAYVLYALTAGSALLLLFLVWRRNREREHQHIEELRELAKHDTLTLLPNRACFGDELSAALGDGASESPPLALFFIDLDRFKNINDSLGHRFGDLVLVAAARRLNAALPAEARLARLGGDEFTVILPNLQREAEIAAIAQALVDAFATPLQVESSEVVVTLSLGISLAPAHTRDGTLLVQYADSAMYQAKGGGRNAYRFFKPEMIAQVSRRHALETSLRHALELGELSPVYQPLFELDGERLSGAEVLLRWHSAEHGIVAPVEFIPILEETGMIESVGLWLVEDVCGRLKRWRQLAPNLRLAVNVSAHQVIRGELCERLAGMLSSQAIPRNALELEMTESTVMENAARIGEVLGELRALGLTIAIDDFGTGYSSFASLSQLPVDKLKIDKAFIDGVGRDEQANTLCAAIVARAHNLKLSVVAEGVESELQHRHLQAMGCDEAQGYWYCRPLTLAAFELFLEQGGRPQAPPLAEAAGAPRLRT